MPENKCWKLSGTAEEWSRDQTRRRFTLLYENYVISEKGKWKRENIEKEREIAVDFGWDDVIVLAGF